MHDERKTAPSEAILPKHSRSKPLSPFRRLRRLSPLRRSPGRRSIMSQTTLKRSVLATLLLLTAGVSAQAADQIFAVRIENVSAGDALKLSNGKTEPVGVAPVLYVIHTNRAPLFTSGKPDRGKGLEALAEDGPTGPLEKIPEGSAGHRPCGLHRHSGWGQQCRRH